MTRSLPLVCMTAALLFAGCSRSDRPDLAPVSGRVTLDGKPLQRAVITFQPQQGRASRAELKPTGHYELLYIRDIKGAKLGQHTVRIGVPGGEGESIGGIVPARYNTATTLSAEVKPEENRFDFNLQSK